MILRTTLMKYEIDLPALDNGSDFAKCMKECNLIDGKSFGYLGPAEICSTEFGIGPQDDEFAECVTAFECGKGIGEFCKKYYGC